MLSLTEILFNNKYSVTMSGPSDSKGSRTHQGAPRSCQEIASGCDTTKATDCLENQS